MGIDVYIKGRDFAFSFKQGRRVAWTARKVKVLRYGKTAAAQEHWLVVYDADTGGKELGRFKGDDVSGFTYYEDRRLAKPQDDPESATSAVARLLGI